jgi:hypothetical protein
LTTGSGRFWVGEILMVRAATVLLATLLSGCFCIAKGEGVYLAEPRTARIGEPIALVIGFFVTYRP